MIKKTKKAHKTITSFKCNIYICMFNAHNWRIAYKFWLYINSFQGARLKI